jgi:enoyl-CoA hydratase/carnithine racemase
LQIVVILRSNGRAFCVGYDIDSDTPERAARRFDALKWRESLTEDLRFEMIPWYMRKPVIASVQGHALGGGCELAMFCDITIAAENAIFGEPEIHFSNVGPAIIMPWMIGFKKARELLYFGDMIDAETALRLGYAAGISCHGTQMLDFIRVLDGVTAPVCIIWGDQDHAAPANVLEAYRAVPARMKNVEVHVYPGVLHGYMMPANPQAFSAPTRKFSLERTLAILGGLREQPVRKAS